MIDRAIRPGGDGRIADDHLNVLVPPERCREALARLRPGRLWHAMLPGVAPRAALETLGERALVTLEVSLSLAGSMEAALREAGYPFLRAGGPPPRAVAAALVADAERLASVPGPGARLFRFSLPPLSRWIASAGACLDAAADAWPLVPDGPLDALLVAPDADLRPVLGLADAGTRVRFAWGMETCGGCPVAFRASHMRRSAAWTMMAGIRAAIEEVPCAIGRDESGWPVWMEVSGKDSVSAAARLPTGLGATLDATMEAAA